MPFPFRQSSQSPSSPAHPVPDGSTAPFRIAIIGAGIAGLSTALFLHHHIISPSSPPCVSSSSSSSSSNPKSTLTPSPSHPPINITITIYEQSPIDRTALGAGIGLGPNATRLLRQIPGLGEACDKIAGRQDGVWFSMRRWENGKEIATLRSGSGGEERMGKGVGDGGLVQGGQGEEKGSGDGNGSVNRQGMGARKGSSGLNVARGELLGLLKEMLEERLRGRGRVKMGRRIVGVEDLGDAVQLRFENGTTAEADLVLACDGIHSAIRQQFVRDCAVYTGKIIYRGLVPMDQLPDPWPFPSYSVMWNGPGRHVVVYAISANKTLNFVGCVSKDNKTIQDFRESWSATCERREMEEDFGDCDETLRRIVSLLPDRLSKWLINDREPVPEWTFLGGKVALLGDAAHPMVPHQSAGGGQAIEDAYIISKTLSAYLERRAIKDLTANLNDWMGLYQSVRLPRARRLQETSREAGLLYHLQVPEMQGKPGDECFRILGQRMSNRLKWIWSEDLDAAYERARLDMLERQEEANAEKAGSKWGWCFCM